MIVLLLVGAYLLGSIPFGLLVGRARGVDIRKHGSGNIGASNVLRLLGPGPAIVVFLGDTLKGLLPVLVSRPLLAHSDLWLLGIGLAAIFGHTFSVFLGFRGGRAVATTLGVLLAISWQAGLVGFGIWLLVVASTRYISLASMTAAAAVPIYLALTGTPLTTTLCWLALAALIIARHIPNLGRLLNGTESKIGQRVKM